MTALLTCIARTIGDADRRLDGTLPTAGGSGLITGAIGRYLWRRADVRVQVR